jgi:hypothetical protein
MKYLNAAFKMTLLLTVLLFLAVPLAADPTEGEPDRSKIWREIPDTTLSLLLKQGYQVVAATSDTYNRWGFQHHAEWLYLMRGSRLFRCGERSGISLEVGEKHAYFEAHRCYECIAPE